MCDVKLYKSQSSVRTRILEQCKADGRCDGSVALLMSKYAHVPNARGEVGGVEAARRDASSRGGELEGDEGSCEGWRLNGRGERAARALMGRGSEVRLRRVL